MFFYSLAVDYSSDREQGVHVRVTDTYGCDRDSIEYVNSICSVQKNIQYCNHHAISHLPEERTAYLSIAIVL